MKTTKSDKLIAAIQELQNAAGNIHDLNCGGCGVFAAAAVKRLNRLGFKAFARVASFSGYGHGLITAKRKGIQSKEDLSNHDVWPDHVIVEAIVGKRRFFFDSEHLTENFDRRLFLNCQLGKGRLDALSALRIVRYPYGWNSRFNRKQIPTLFRQMNQAISNLA